MTIGAATIIHFQFQKKGKKKEEKTSTEFSIKSKAITVKNQSYPAKINFTGRVRAVDRIDMFAEVTGVLLKTTPNFKEGNYFKKGKTLIRIDDREMRLQLVSKKSQYINAITKIIPDLRIDFAQDASVWEQYLNSLDPHKTLTSLPKISNQKLNYFISGRNINDTYYEIKSLETKLSKYIIRAPFDGIVSQANITQGTLVRVGQDLGEFISSNHYELEAAVSFKDLKFLELGHVVKLQSKDLDRKLTGSLYRISDVINEETQTINIYVKIESYGFVKEGMYLQGSVNGNAINDAFALPRILLQQGDIVYTIAQDSTLKHTPVDVITVNNDEVIVKGLKNGIKIINKSLSRGVEGTKIQMIEE